MSPAPAGSGDRAGGLRRVAALALAGTLFVTSASAPALAFELFGRKFFEREDEIEIVPDPRPYVLTLDIAGGDKDLAKTIRGASMLAREEDKPPPGTAGLVARARGDYGRITAALYANGYYGGSVVISVNGQRVEEVRPDAVLPNPAPVTVAVDPGPAFTFGEVRVNGLPADPMTREDRSALQLGKWQLVEGESARSGEILSAEGRLLEFWRQRGHPTAEIVGREIVADHRTNTVDVTLSVQPGPAARFGTVEVSGTERVDPEYARYMTGIKPGEDYDPDTLERSRKRMQDIGVFGSVAIAEGESVGPDGLLPITFNLTERKRRLIGGGVSYSTVDGAAVEGYWMHRNLFGHAESLRFDAAISRIGAEDVTDFSYLLATTFRRPGMFTPNTDATLKIAAERETVDSYESTTFSARAGLEHRFGYSPDITLSSAVNVERAVIEDAFGENRYFLLSLPTRLDYDARDNKLDPTEGFRGTLDAEPLTDVLAGTFAVVMRGTISGYYGFGADNRLVIAGRTSLGTIPGSGDLEDVPATRRFFLGGGGSIRGYEYRTVGPKIGDETVGGLSFWEASLEARYRLTDTIGIVPFIDIGSAYSDAIPDFGEDLRIGAGIGLRYYTSLGPLRVDFAVPLNPGDDDPSYAVYVGLGQTF